jgi:hypothetical protein
MLNGTAPFARRTALLDDLTLSSAFRATGDVLNDYLARSLPPSAFLRLSSRSLARRAAMALRSVLGAGPAACLASGLSGIAHFLFPAGNDARERHRKLHLDVGAARGSGAAASEESIEDSASTHPQAEAAEIEVEAGEEVGEVDVAEELVL